MKKAPISKLGCALLGLLQQRPASGYALRKIFSTTAMTTYSDSPGAIYPALRRLLQQGLIRGSVERGAGMRRRQVFRLTSKGLAELKNWIALPVTQGDIIRGLDELMLRFAFSEQAAGPAVTIKLLKSMRGELSAYIPCLQQQLQAGRAVMPTSGRLALENGIMSYESFLQWTRHALTTYEQEREKSEKGNKEESSKKRSKSS